MFLLVFNLTSRVWKDLEEVPDPYLVWYSHTWRFKNSYQKINKAFLTWSLNWKIVYKLVYKQTSTAMIHSNNRIPRLTDISADMSKLEEQRRK